MSKIQGLTGSDILLKQPRFYLLALTGLATSAWIIYERFIDPEQIIGHGFVLIAGFALVSWLLTSQSFIRRFIGSASADSLAFIRIVTGICFLINVVWIIDVPTTTLLPVSMRHPMGLMQYLYAIPGFDGFVSSTTSLNLLKTLAILVAISIITGFKTRWVLPLGTLLSFLWGGINRQYFYFYHQGILVSYMMLILSFTPCGDGFSVDRLMNLYRGKSVVDPTEKFPIYGWSRYACWVLLVISYLASGASKLKVSGLLWLSPLNLRGMMYSCTLQRCNNFDWTSSLQYGPHLPDGLFLIFGLVGTLGEIAFVLILFSSLARQFFPLLMVALHLGIFVFQNILFVEFILFQAIVYDFSRLRETVFPWLNRLKAKYVHFERLSLRAQPANSLAVSKSSQSILFPLLISSLVTLIVFCWQYSIKFYPFSSFHLFAYRDLSGIVVYDKIYAHLSTGNVIRLYPEKVIPAQFVASYRRITNTCFLEGAEQTNYCRAYLEAVGHAYNDQASHGDASDDSSQALIEQLEVQRWQWDFVKNSTDKNYGKLVDEYQVKLP